MEQGSDINSVFTRLSKACIKIQTHMQFAHSPQLGFITSRPSTLGTALRVTIHVVLPGVENHRKQFKAIADRHMMTFKSLIKNNHQPIDHLWELSNRKRLGHSEVELI